MDNELQTRVTLNVRTLLGVRGLGPDTQAELADRLDTSAKYLNAKMHNRERWTLENLEQLAAAFGTTVGRLTDTDLPGVVSEAMGINGSCSPEDQLREAA